MFINVCHIQMYMNSRFKGTINSMFIHYFLILLLTFTTPIIPATTDAVAEDIPFGQASTYLNRSLYKIFIALANSEYKYMMDIPKNNEIIVAVIDDYMSSDHESLQGQYWVNTAEKNGATGVDDDGNGYIDDIHGWDFDGDQPYKIQFSSPHGNQVAGIIMGNPITEPYSGYEHRIRGVNPDVKVMRIYQGDTVLSAEKEAEAIRYAVDNGAKVINLSHRLADNGNSDILNAVTYAKTNGVFVVLGGPNSGSTNMFNMDQFDDVFAVARNNYVSGTGQDVGDIYHFTGVWHEKIDYCLPQKMKAISNSAANIGTSFSTPLLSGIIARLLMYDNTITHDEMRTILDDNSINSTGTTYDSNVGSHSYTCKRPSAELLFKNYYGGQILRKSVKIQNPAGKDVIFNIETVVNSSGTVIRREVRHVNSGKNRYWVSREVN